MDLADIITDETIFIDVRTVEEFPEDNLEGSINIPLDDVFRRVEYFKQLKKPIILFCHSGSRSQMAVDFLKSQVVENVFNGSALSDLKK